MKTCIECKNQRTLEDFSWKNKKLGLRHSRCRICHRLFCKKWYDSNKEKQLECVRKNNVRYKDRNREYIWEYLLKHPCVDCGETDPVILEFDHREPKHKSCNVSDFVRTKACLKRLITEIEKCDVRCANCHRRKTAKQLGWWIDKCPRSSIGRTEDSKSS